MSHHQFSDTLGRRRWGIEHGKSFAARILHIDVVHAHASSANEFQSWTGVDQRPSDFGCGANKDAVDGFLMEEGFKMFGRHKFGVQGVPSVLEGFCAGRADAVVCEDVHEGRSVVLWGKGFSRGCVQRRP